MATNISSTSLDFVNIRNNLKTYFAQKPEFADYNFDAAGLSNILDVLAYNTHYNGLIANLATNESFLSSAQLRASVISHAESLGVNVRSKTASICELVVSVNLGGLNPRPASITLPIGTTFTAVSDNITYTFKTLEKYTATDDGSGTFTFADSKGTLIVKAVEGIEYSKTFYVGEVAENQVYVIPEANLDTTTAVVKVFDSPTSAEYTTYTPLYKAITVNSTSTYYTLRETPNGYFEINFGDGITFGKRPEAGSKIVITYMVPNGAVANGLKTFTTANEINIDGVDYPLALVLSSRSHSGGEKQSIESIRQNAPIAFATQQRLVTASDYEALIRTNFSQIDDVSAWGGQDNFPIDYGKVFVSIDFEDNTSENTKISLKNSITENFAKNLSVMSITTEFVDPQELYFNIECDVQFNPEKTAATAAAINNNVLSQINSHFNEKLNGFKKTFRKSTLLTEIDNLSPAILSTAIRIKNQLRFVPNINIKANYEIYFPFAVALPDDDYYSIISTEFKIQESAKFARFQNKLNSSTLQIVATDGEVLVDNCGFIDTISGKVVIYSFNPSTIYDGTNYLKLIVIPADQNTIRPMRNYTMKIDNTLTTVSSNIDKNQILSRI